MSEDNIKSNQEGEEHPIQDSENIASKETSSSKLSRQEPESSEEDIDIDAVLDSSPVVEIEEEIEEEVVDESIDEAAAQDHFVYRKEELNEALEEKENVPSINEMYANGVSQVTQPSKEIKSDPPVKKEIAETIPEKPIVSKKPDINIQKSTAPKEEPKPETNPQPRIPMLPPLPPKDQWGPIKQNHEFIVKGMWYLLAASFVGIVLLFIGLSFTDLPDTKALENPQNELASQVYASNGEVLGRYFVENRVPVNFGALSDNIHNALVSTEDERFYNHCGIDFRALGRTGFKTILLQKKSAGGASTITQQLARLLFTGKKAAGFQRVVQKLKEWIIAVRLESKYTKQEIMTMYLNKFDFLYDSYGIVAAAETYFGKPQDSLNVEEAAMLVGMLKNPSLFNPRRRPDTVRHRREVVLKQMLKNDYLDRTIYDSLRALPLDISNFTRKTHTQGLAQYFRMELGKHLKNILKGEHSKKKSNGEPYDIYRDGLKIFTTIDPIYQKHAEEAMWEHMSSLQRKFNRYWTSRSKNPWRYRDEETTQGELRAREWKLKQMIQNSDRYLAMRNNYLSEDLLKRLTAKVEGLRLRDIDIERMLEAEKSKTYLRRLKSQNLIDDDMVKQYRAAIKRKEWEIIKSNWEKLEEAVEIAFDEEVKMRVFAYNDKMETDTVMTPLDSIKYHHNFLQIGSIAIDPRTGFVKAWIGGINQKYFAFDHTSTNRQVGSTFKSFVYAKAIQELGISPCEPIDDLPRTIFPGEKSFQLLEPWTPANSSGEYTGERMTLKHALRKSVNTVSVELMKRLGGTKEVRDLARELGIDVDKKYPNGQLRVPDVPSICLGSCDLTVMEMAGAYSAFANNGTYLEPVFISKIQDKTGREIYPNTYQQKENVGLESDKNYVMVQMLQYASGGLGLKSPVGGKTGTTNDYVDGWFVGITPNLVTATWVGGEDRWIRFLDLGNGQGSRMARPFFIKFMKALEADSTANYNYKAQFPIPDIPVNIELDCDLYENASIFGEDEFDSKEDGLFEDPFGDELEFEEADTIGNFDLQRNLN